LDVDKCNLAPSGVGGRGNLAVCKTEVVVMVVAMVVKVGKALVAFMDI